MALTDHTDTTTEESSPYFTRILLGHDYSSLNWIPPSDSDVSAPDENAVIDLNAVKKHLDEDPLKPQRQ